MKTKLTIFFAILIGAFGIATAQEYEPAKKNEAYKEAEIAVEKVLLDYIEGTAEGQPERIRRAFHKDLNLYSIKDDSLSVLSGIKYISYFKEGQKRDRVGKITNIDIVNNAASAIIEIDVPSRKTLYTDFLLLLKIEGNWYIIHKSFTSEGY